jgi:hypothetical protein
VCGPRRESNPQPSDTLGSLPSAQTIEFTGVDYEGLESDSIESGRLFVDLLHHLIQHGGCALC